MTARTFFQLITTGDPRLVERCVLADAPESMGLHAHTLSMGVRAAPHYPARARVSLREENPGIERTDLLSNTRGFLVVSSALDAVIAEHTQGVDVEHLPVDLLDHRGRVHSRDYVFVNPIGELDCLDEQASGLVFGPAGGVVSFRYPLFDRAKTEQAPALFRIRHMPSEYVIDGALAEAIRGRGFSNVLFCPSLFADEVGRPPG